MCVCGGGGKSERKKRGGGKYMWNRGSRTVDEDVLIHKLFSKTTPERIPPCPAPETEIWAHRTKRMKRKGQRVRKNNNSNNNNNNKTSLKTIQY